MEGIDYSVWATNGSDIWELFDYCPKRHLRPLLIRRHQSIGKGNWCVVRHSDGVVIAQKKDATLWQSQQLA